MGTLIVSTWDRRVLIFVSSLLYEHVRATQRFTLGYSLKFTLIFIVGFTRVFIGETLHDLV